MLFLSSLLIAALIPNARGGHEPKLLPNLRVRRPPYVKIQEIDKRRGDPTKKLRFDTEVANRGMGPLELQATTANCEGDPRRFTTFQRIFRDAEDGDGIFDREVDTTSVEEEAGCVIYHPAHEHWHFENFARYRLFRIRRDGTLVKKAVADSDKVSFCMTDSDPLNTKPEGQPERALLPRHPSGLPARPRHEDLPAYGYLRRLVRPLRLHPRRAGSTDNPSARRPLLLADPARPCRPPERDERERQRPLAEVAYRGDARREEAGGSLYAVNQAAKER
jgi:hypothetical protein